MLDVRVAELMCSRVCHDLVSPVGAINNGVELVEELGGEMADDALSLVGQSSRRATAVLQLFRLAYGGAGGQDNLGLGQVRETASVYLADGKVSFDWRIPTTDNGHHMPPGTVKLLLNLVVLAEETLTHGGTIAVSSNGESPPGQLTVTAEGREAALPAALEAALAGDVAVDELTPRTVHAYVSGVFARYYRLSLAFERDSGRSIVFFLDLNT